MTCWGILLQSYSIWSSQTSIVDITINNRTFKFKFISIHSYIFTMLRKVAKTLVNSHTLKFYFSDMKVGVDEQNYVVFDPKIGARIIELRLAGRVIIKGEYNGLGNADYLMFPWVNRIEKVPYQAEHPYTDGNGLPIHGLYVDSPRNIMVFPISAESIGIQLEPEAKYPDVPKFKETYILSKGSFQQKIKVDSAGPQHEKVPFCFGYHPYLQIDQEDIKDMKISTDIKTNLALDHRLVTLFPFQRKDLTVSPLETYDSLFEGGTYLQLTNPTGFNVRISSQLPYWQIYTPPEGKRIAVEPMSFVGNLYDISKQGECPTLNEGSLEIKAWQE